MKSEPKNQKSSRTTRLTNCGSFGGGSASPRMSRATNSAAAPLSASRRTRSMDGCGGRNQQSNLPAALQLCSFPESQRPTSNAARDLNTTGGVRVVEWSPSRRRDLNRSRPLTRAVWSIAHARGGRGEVEAV